MRIQRPHTAFATLSDLVLSLPSIEQHPTPIVDEALRQSLAQAVANLRDASSRLDQAKIEKRRAVSERKVEGTIMIRAVRDFYHVLTRRVQRDPDAQVWLSAFGSPEHMPKDRTPTSEWFELARTIAAAGEAVSAKLAKDKGAYPTPPPSNPSAEEVAATLPSAEATDKAWRNGVAHHKQCEAALIAARQRGQRLLGHLRARLLALFQGLPPEQRRVKLLARASKAGK